MTAWDLLGLCINGDAVRDYAAKHGETPTVRDDDGILDVELASLGIALVAPADSGIIRTVFMYNEGVEPGYTRYDGPLPQGINFRMGRSEIQAVMGHPGFSSPQHDAWDFQEFRLSVQYRGTLPSVISVTTDR